MSDEQEDIILDEDGAEVPATLQKLKEKLIQCQKERQEYLDGWQRARADFVNLKKEEAESRVQTKARVEEDLAEKLIPLMDAFEAGFAHTSWEKGDRAFTTGIEGIYKEFGRILKDLGVESFEPTGEAFDPALHMPVREEPGESGKVLRVERKGYKRGATIIRPAFVVLGS